MSAISTPLPLGASLISIAYPRLELYLSVGPDTLAVAVRYLSREQHAAAPVPLRRAPEDLEFRSVAFTARGELSMTPTLYLEPYVVDIEKPFLIRPGDTIEGYILLPPLLRIADETGRMAFEVRTVRPKDAWYGDPKGGAPGMSAASEFLFEGQGGKVRATASWRIICPVTIHNETDTDAEFTRMCVPTEGMSLYRSGELILCDRVDCVISPIGVQVDVRKGLPASFEPATLVERARQSPEARFFARGFSMLMRIAGK